MFSIWQPCPGLGGLCRQSFYTCRSIARVGIARICPQKQKKSAQPDVQCSTSSSSPVEPPEFGGFGVVRGPFVSRFPIDAPERRTFPRRINNWVASPSEVILHTNWKSRFSSFPAGLFFSFRCLRPTLVARCSVPQRHSFYLLLFLIRKTATVAIHR